MSKVSGSGATPPPFWPSTTQATRATDPASPSGAGGPSKPGGVLGGRSVALAGPSRDAPSAGHVAPSLLPPGTGARVPLAEREVRHAPAGPAPFDLAAAEAALAALVGKSVDLGRP